MGYWHVESWVCLVRNSLRGTFVDELEDSCIETWLTKRVHQIWVICSKRQAFWQDNSKTNWSNSKPGSLFGFRELFRDKIVAWLKGITEENVGIKPRETYITMRGNIIFGIEPAVGELVGRSRLEINHNQLN